MNGFLGFVSDPHVHDTVLVTMVVSSFILALPHPSADPNTWWKVLYKFGYDWLTGFWSMKTGGQLASNPIPPVTNPDPTPKK